MSSTGSASVAVDEDIENDRQPLQEPGLPTAPASTFFSKRAKSPPQLTFDADRSIVHHNDASVGWHCREGSLDCSFCGSFFDSCILFWSWVTNHSSSCIVQQFEDPEPLGEP